MRRISSRMSRSKISPSRALTRMVTRLLAAKLSWYLRCTCTYGWSWGTMSLKRVRMSRPPSEAAKATVASAMATQTMTRLRMDQAARRAV
ncbi:hypothetical protein D3C77_622340 [compost metagenome]